MNDKEITLDDFCDPSQTAEIMKKFMKQVTEDNVEDPVLIWIEKEGYEKIREASTKRDLTPYEILVDCIKIGLHIITPETEPQPLMMVPDAYPHHLPRPDSPAERPTTETKEE